MAWLHPHAEAFGSSSDTGLSQQIKTRYCRSCCLFLWWWLLRKSASSAVLEVCRHTSVWWNCLFGAEKQTNVLGFHSAVLSMK